MSYLHPTYSEKSFIRSVPILIRFVQVIKFRKTNLFLNHLLQLSIWILGLLSGNDIDKVTGNTYKCLSHFKPFIKIIKRNIWLGLHFNILMKGSKCERRFKVFAVTLLISLPNDLIKLFYSNKYSKIRGNWNKIVRLLLSTTPSLF